MHVWVRVYFAFRLCLHFLRPCTKFEDQKGQLHLRPMNFMTSLVVTMEMDYHGVFVRTLDPSGPTRSLLCIYERGLSVSKLRRLFLLNVCTHI